MISGCVSLRGEEKKEVSIDWLNVQAKPTTTEVSTTLEPSTTIVSTTFLSTSTTTSSTTTTTTTTIKRCLRNGPKCLDVENVRLRLNDVIPKKMQVQDRLRVCKNDSECVLVNDCCGEYYGNKYPINKQWQDSWNIDLNVLCKKEEYKYGCGWTATTVQKARCEMDLCVISYGGITKDDLSDDPNPVMNFSYVKAKPWNMSS